MSGKSNKFQRVGARIEKNHSFLRTVARTKSEHKRARLLSNASEDEILALVEICHNILRSRFRLTNRQCMKILPHVVLVRKLGRIRSERGAKRALFQYGSGVGVAVSSLLVPVLAELVRMIKFRGGSDDS